MQEPKSYDSSFALWGKRDYVQGGHMIYQLLEAAKAWGLGKIDMLEASFRLRMREQGRYLIFDGKVDRHEKEKIYAKFKLYFQDKVYSVSLIGDGRSLDKVIPDDEKELILNGNIIKEKKVATIKEFSIKRFINVIIALNKKLHKETITSKGFGPWIIAQLNLHFGEIDFSQTKNVIIQLESIIGNKMTKSIIQVNGKKSGEILFTRRALL